MRVYLYTAQCHHFVILFSYAQTLETLLDNGRIMYQRSGDRDPSLALLVSTYKLIGNSVYGKTITNKERHVNVSYKSDPTDVSLAIASRRFIGLDCFESGVCELVHSKRKLTLDVPVVIGFSILQLAKLRMLEFYYDCIDVFVDRRHFQYVEMDTDSAYMALSAPLRSVIRSDRVARFYNKYERWFPRPYCPAHRDEFLVAAVSGSSWEARDCCSRTHLSDTRTPGLFKEEFRGDGIVALNSKTYFCWRHDDSECKFSCKGLSKKTNSVTAAIYKNVLDSREPYVGQNVGFQRHKNIMYTVAQERAGLTYFYAKREVLADGVSTKSVSF